MEKLQSTGENEKPKRNYSCLGSFLAFSGIVIVMAIHSTYTWTALTLSILIICVLYIFFAIITYFVIFSKKHYDRYELHKRRTQNNGVYHNPD